MPAAGQRLTLAAADPMKTRSLALYLGPVLVLGAIAVSVLAYDDARGDIIPKGVQVGGVAVGGLSPAEARTKLESVYLKGLQRPVMVHWDRATWTLGAREAKIQANIDAMVTAAGAFKDEGNILSRSWRRMTGGKLDRDLQPSVSYSDAAIIRLLDNVRKGVNRKPQDASVAFSPAGFKRVKSRTGLTVDASKLHREIRAAIISPSASRRFVAQTAKVQPQVTNAKLGSSYKTMLFVDRAGFKLRLYKNLKLVKSYGIAVGQVGLETPAGLYHIQNKQINPAWSVPNSAWAGSLAGTVVPGGTPQNPLKARWLGIFDGAGIHGTDSVGSIGSAASHGCVRMLIPDVIDLYDRVPVGAPIYIA
jgi:lipoprotein-anchoring transpeptidase ErfK/SrfK